MRRLRSLPTLAYLWILAFLADHSEPARWCPLCRAPSSLSRWRWVWIEARDEEVVCANCCRIPRLWVKERT